MLLVQINNTREVEHDRDNSGISSETFLLAAERWIGLYNRARALVETKQAELRRTVTESIASTGARSGEQYRYSDLVNLLRESH